MFEGYRIISQIGEGGAGTVWRALQLSTQREVALKMLGMGTFCSRRTRLRFEREVELTARLEHPNIARVYESGLHRGGYYYTMELIDGEHLNKYIANHHLTQRQILQLVRTVCQAVQYAHQRGVIHRDLKPSNIIVTADGQPHILDFGLAKALLEDDKSRMVSVDGDVAGTPAYMSPEQAGGHLDEIDTRTDVYSLGVILFNVLTGQWPYDLSGSHYEVLRNIQEKEPALPSKIAPRFDADVEAIILKALAKKPAERYQSVAELAYDIQCWLEGLPIVARSVNTLYLLKKLILRHRTAAVVAGLLLVIIISTAFVSLYSYGQAQRALKDLQAKQELYERAAERDLVFATQIAFASFLKLWHNGELDGAQEAADHFAGGSREDIAARFLLDARPLEEKQADLQQKLSASQPSFCAFIIGEHYLKSKNMPEAIAAYKRCLDTHQDSSDLDQWFKKWAARRLDTLVTESVMLNSRRNLNEAE
jgi:serine/threonine-protein kinase